MSSEQAKVVTPAPLADRIVFEGEDGRAVLLSEMPATLREGILAHFKGRDTDRLIVVPFDELAQSVAGDSALSRTVVKC